MPIITQTLNINILRSTSAKSINLHTTRKLVKYSFKMCSKILFTLSLLGRLLSEGRSVFCHAQGGTGRKRVKVSVKNQKNIVNLLKLLEK